MILVLFTQQSIAIPFATKDSITIGLLHRSNSLSNRKVCYCHEHLSHHDASFPYQTLNESFTTHQDLYSAICSTLLSASCDQSTHLFSFP